MAFTKAVVLYQSTFFQDIFPEEDKRFGNVVYVEATSGDREASLFRMRETMLSRGDLEAGVFVGGMEGILAEYDTLTRSHPNAKVVTVPAAGGAARQLAEKLEVTNTAELRNVDFAKLFHLALNVAPNEPRTSSA